MPIQRLTTMNINEKSFPLILLIIVQPFFLILLNLANLNTKAYPLGTIAAHNFVIGIFSLIITITALLLVKKIIEMVEKETETRLQMENLENIQEMVQTMRSQRHDFNNHIQTVHGLISVGAYEEAKEYMNDVIVPIQSSNRILSDNPSVTALLQVKANRAESKGIEIDFAVKGSLKEPLMPVKDLNTILGNLLDNAIEATEENASGKKHIKTLVKSEKSSLYITIANTGTQLEEPIKQRIFQPGFTTKRQGQGMGLWSIKKITDTYGGSIKVENQADGVRFELVFHSSNPGG